MSQGNHRPYDMTCLVTGAAFILSAAVFYAAKGISGKAALAFVVPGLLLVLAGLGLHRRKRG